MQSSVNNSFADLGANTFDIRGPQPFRRRNGGMRFKDFPSITYRQSMQYKREIKDTYNAQVSISSNISGAVQVKYKSVQTNPNTRVVGIDDNFMAIKGYKLTNGRNFSQTDLDNALNVVIIGSEIAQKLFEGKVNPINEEIVVRGNQYKVVGVLDKKGSLTGEEMIAYY